MPGGRHGLYATGGQLGIAPPPSHACTGHGPGKGLEVDPKGLGAGCGRAPSPWALQQAAGGWGGGGGHLRLQPAPPRPLPGAALAAGAGTGTGPGGGCPRALRGKGTIPGHFFFGRPPACPPPPLSCAPLPVLLPRRGAELQLNQCSANNLPANKTFSSLSLLPPTPPQSVCDGSALI